MASRTTLVIFALFGLLAVAALPASAQYRSHSYYDSDRDGEFRLRIGAFEPDGSSGYWDNIRHEFTGSSTSDFQAPDFGLDYILPLNGPLNLIFSGSVYQGSSTNSYRGSTRRWTSPPSPPACSSASPPGASPSSPTSPWVGASIRGG